MLFWWDLKDHLSLSVDALLLSILIPQKESWVYGSLNSTGAVSWEEQSKYLILASTPLASFQTTACLFSPCPAGGPAFPGIPHLWDGVEAEPSAPFCKFPML